MRTIKGYSILSYTPPEEWAGDGIVLPSASMMRQYLKSAGDKTIQAGDTPPDVYRYGELVAGDLEVPSGYLVCFNRHDAEEFEYEGRTYYRINNLNALAYVSPETLVA